MTGLSKRYEKMMEYLLLCAAGVSVVAVILIIVFVFANGFPAIARIGLGHFLLGSTWRPTNGSFGILSMVCGTLSVTGLALLIGVPTGVASAILLAEILPKKIAGVFKFAVELLAGIPSVVYGFFGIVVVVPFIKNTIFPLWQQFAPDASTTGFSVLAGGLILAIMILPTIVSLSENAISAVPIEYREASLAIGAQRSETTLSVIVPAAKSGILASIILGMGRALGETMAVLLITGNVAMIPRSIFDPVATLTGTIALEMGYAGDEHRQALFAVGIILFCVIFLLNLLARAFAKKTGGAGR